MDAELLLPALCTGFGLGALAAALRALTAAARLWARGERVPGVVIPRTAYDRRPGGLVSYTDRLGRAFVLDPGRHGPLHGLPGIGATVPVVHARGRPDQARLWSVRALLAPSFGWFLTSALACGTALAVLP